jgi:hypothetical protein
MVRRTEKPQRYAKGGRFGGTQLSRAGISAIEQQSKTTTDALREQARVQKELDKTQIAGMTRRNTLMQKNAEEVYKLETDAPYKARMNALKTNAEVQIKSYNDQAKEYDRLAGVWGSLSPTLAKNFQSLAQSTEDYIATTNAIDEFNTLASDGTLDKIKYTYNRVGQSSALDDAANQQTKLVEQALGGDLDAEQEFDYMGQVMKTRNPVLQKLLFNDIKTNFDSIEQDMLASVEGDIDKFTATRLYQTRAIQILNRLGINPKSETGFKIQELFRQKGLVKESQLSLEQQYMDRTAVIDSGLNQIEAALEANNYKEAQAVWKTVQNNVYSLPVKNREGVYSRKVTLNKADEFYTWAESLVGDSRFAGEAGWIKYQKVVLGIDENNEYGYEITGATGNKNAKHNRIIGKHPNFLIGLREKWEKADSANTKAIEHVNDRRLQAEAKPYIDKLANGSYFNPDRSIKQEFYSDWQKTNGNKYAREAFAELIGYDSENVDENTFNSTLLQAYRNGDLMATYMTWAVDYNDDQQEIGFIMRDLQGLAQARGTEVKGLDEKLLPFFEKKLAKVLGADSLEDVMDESSTDKAREMLGATLAVFSETAGTGKSIEERYNDAVSVVDVLLGIDSKTGTPIPFDNRGYRGEGAFKQKRTKDGKVLFVRDSGVIFNGITSIEINDRLTGNFGNELKGDKRQTSLMNLINEQVKDGNVSADDFYNFVNGEPNNNRFLNHIESEQLGDVNAVKLKNAIKSKLNTKAAQKQTAIQWGADEWCDHHLGPTADGVYGKDLSKKAFGVCMEALKKDAAAQGVELYQLLLNKQIRDKFLQ